MMISSSNMLALDTMGAMLSLCSIVPNNTASFSFGTTIMRNNILQHFQGKHIVSYFSVVFVITSQFRLLLARFIATAIISAIELFAEVAFAGDCAPGVKFKPSQISKLVFDI
ncbi:hypothetical protein BC830DRAFT_1112779 [Chytriomyces sp. MP71]|nr:hypothetical protein BC830DRAFT_1112779 [Chytriomyces sp. MP71]